MNIPFPIDDDVLSIQFSASAEFDPRTPMWRAIGIFISNYAKVETALHMYAQYLTGLDFAKARVLLSNQKAHEIAARIKSLLPLSGASSLNITEFEVLEEQIKKITCARHILVHNGVTFINETEVLAHKKAQSKTITSYERKNFSQEQILAMVDDCACIAIRLLALRDPAILCAGVLEKDKEEYLAFLLSPWRY
jgi:hypothetical protein